MPSHQALIALFEENDRAGGAPGHGWLGETLSPVKAAGLGLILAGVILLRLPDRW